MAMRVKNVQQGFVDSNGVFHPIRASDDYSASRAGEARKKKKAAPPVKRRRTATTKRKKVVTRRKAATKRRATTKRKAAASRKRNPIPANWVPAKVRKLGKDIQVMFTGRPKKRATARKRTRRR